MAFPPSSKAAKPDPSASRPGEIKICGLSAVRARFKRDAGSIRRLYFDYETGRKIGLICKALAATRKIYRCLEPADLEKVAGTLHHGGVVAGEPAAWARKNEPVIVLDRIGNAHNLGAIARTAAFFGVGRIVISEDPASARPNDAAYRVAEGGFEFIDVRAAPSLPAFLRELSAAGYAVLGATAHGEGSRAAARAKDSAKAAVALVLGNEEHGLSPPRVRGW
jgi:TrmH RNA methyltransferase